MTDPKPMDDLLTIELRLVERVWGRRDLRPWYSTATTAPIGEAWLTSGDCTVSSGEHAGETLEALVARHPKELGNGVGAFPLLAKLLFPDEKLSVQVHPDDAQAQLMGGAALPKTECWYVLQAEDDAVVYLDFVPGTTEEQVRAALGTPQFETLMQSVPVKTGDMVYVEAGTVHAIGPGVTLLEVQQPSDTTFRLYDYGRPRELHLEEGMSVIKLQNNSGKVQPVAGSSGSCLIDVPHFRVVRYDALEAQPVRLNAVQSAACLVALEGDAIVENHAGAVRLSRGAAVVVPASLEGVEVRGTCSFVHCTVPLNAS